jgi:hypothetical protein
LLWRGLTITAQFGTFSPNQDTIEQWRKYISKPVSSSLVRLRATMWVANANKKQHLAKVCLKLGKTPPTIVTPDVLWESDNDRT